MGHAQTRARPEQMAIQSFRISRFEWRIHVFSMPHDLSSEPDYVDLSLRGSSC